MSRLAEPLSERSRREAISRGVAVAAGAAAVGVAVALADGGWVASITGALAAAVAAWLASARRGSDEAQAVAAQAAARSDGDVVRLGELEVLKRAIEVRCAQRTALLDASTDAVLLVDRHGETLYANRAAAQLLGEAAAAAGTRAALAELPAVVGRAVQGVVSGHGGERRRIECDLRDDRAAPVVVQVVAVGTPGDGHAAILVRDVRAEREAGRMKSEFVAKASHELRTPLAALRASAEMLADGEFKSEAERTESIEIMLVECQRLEDLVDRMLDIGRIESGMARMHAEPVDLSRLAAECVTEQAPAALARRISLRTGMLEQGAIALADRPNIKQVLLNLISNAIKYTPEGGEVAVEVGIDNLAKSVVVSVRDNGIGIPDTALPKLFGKFYRVENHEKVAKGTGLGLNLCRNIVEAMHGGQIGVDSRVGQGSRFWFTVPMEQATKRAA